MLNGSSNLGASVEASATNRPVKIAYLVPYNDDKNTQLILDAVFFESYTRWGGIYTLIVPTDTSNFLSDEYERWIKFFDPDFIYSYIDLNADFVHKIDRLTCPIAILKHELHVREGRDIVWRSFLPNWSRYIHPISSMSTVLAPGTNPRLDAEQPSERTVFTQYGMEPDNRFLSDNFGTGFDLHTVTHSVPGLYKTLCLTHPDLPENIVAGTDRCHTTTEALKAIGDRQVTSIARLAWLNASGMPYIESSIWNSSFRLYVGLSPLDRIDFWNSRQLGNEWTKCNAMIIDSSVLEDEELIKQLGDYLNKNNFIRSSNGPNMVNIYSRSLSEEQLNSIRDALQPHTWNSIQVGREFDRSAVPNENDLKGRNLIRSTDSTSYKLTDDKNIITANEPAHLIYVPPQYKSIIYGQWVVDLDIQRNNNLSRFSNVIDSWSLPRRCRITRAFTKRLSKPTIAGQLAIIPSTEAFPHRPSEINASFTYELYQPSDESFFRYLVLDFHQYPTDDMRASIPSIGYKNMAISDKGQNLRGVISLFDSLYTAYEVLTNKYWRTVFYEAKSDTAKPLTFDNNKLESLLPNERETIRDLTEELHLNNPGVTKEYLRDSLKDTLEYLVRINVIYQVAHWRCEYCGHMNSRSFDKMKIKNSCDICSTAYYTPIDSEWKYEINDFVYRSLIKHTGLPVLWSLGYLQDQYYSGGYWYVPEVDLYIDDHDPNNKNEIDILCIQGGVYYAVEVKKSVSTFVNKEGSIDKFIEVINNLAPDIALLSFQRYCPDEGDESDIKKKLADAVKDISGKIGSDKKLEVIVAQDIQDYNKFSADIGWFGSRVHKY